MGNTKPRNAIDQTTKGIGEAEQATGTRLKSVHVNLMKIQLSAEKICEGIDGINIDDDRRRELNKSLLSVFESLDLLYAKTDLNYTYLKDSISKFKKVLSARISGKGSPVLGVNRRNETEGPKD